jgi:exonuclease VII small subunit
VGGVLLGDATQLFRKGLGAYRSLSGQLAHARQQGARIVEREDRAAH